MKNLNRIAFCSSLALLLAALPATAGHGPGFGPHGRFGAGHRAEHLAEHLAERLGLSEAQRDQVRTIHESYRDDVELLMETVRTARQDLGDRIHAETFDETAIRAAAGQLAAAEADLAVLRGRIASDVRGVLTPEQAEQARALHERMQEFDGGWRGHREHHGRWGRGGPEGPPADGQ